MALIVIIIAMVIDIENGAKKDESQHNYVGQGNSVYVMHDDMRNVTCWVYDFYGGISCIPDRELDK